MTTHRSLPLLALLLASAGGCADDAASTETPRSQASACSTGTPYGAETTFPPGAREGAGPACTLRCGDTSSATWGAGGIPKPTISALPSGTCADEGSVCNLDAVKPCNRPDHGTLMLFECRCTAGTWACVAEYKGGGACSVGDAGAPTGG